MLNSHFPGLVLRCSPAKNKVLVFTILISISMASFLSLVSIYSVDMAGLNSFISCKEAFEDCRSGNDDGVDNNIASLCEDCQEW